MVVQICVNPARAGGGLRCGSCGLQELPANGLNGFGKIIVAANAWTPAATRWKCSRRRLSENSGETILRKSSIQLRDGPFVRTLRSWGGSRQRRLSWDEFPLIRSSRKPSMPDLDDEVEELPSVYKGRRKGSSLEEEDHGDRGFFSWNRNTNPSGEPARSADRTASSGSLNKYILAGLFVMGIGAGIGLDTVVNIQSSNVASREVIDRQTPNPDVCIANGMSAMVLDQRLFITFNPFNVYVSQAEVKPGCVLRQSNWRVLESRGLVNSQEVRDCKRNFNTFGFVGDLRQAPEVTCVYHSENAENQFLKDPAKAALGDGFQPKDFSEP